MLSDISFSFSIDAQMIRRCDRVGGGGDGEGGQ